MAAGDILKAIDEAPGVGSADATTVAIATTAYAQSSPTFGVAFTAPTSGKVRINFRARCECKVNSSRVTVSAELAAGGTIGSGAVIAAGTDDECIETRQDAAAATTPALTRINAGQYRYVTGLTPGNPYNAYIVHKGFAASGGTIYSRGILVESVA